MIEKAFYLLLAMAIVAYLSVQITVSITKYKVPVIDLPEEYGQLRANDTLRVYKVSKDTIYIGFYNKRNR